MGALRKEVFLKIECGGVNHIEERTTVNEKTVSGRFGE